MIIHIMDFLLEFITNITDTTLFFNYVAVLAVLAMFGMVTNRL